MSRRTRFVGLLLLMQTGCFAAGIWLQHFCISWTTREALWKHDVSFMDVQSALMADHLRNESAGGKAVLASALRLYTRASDEPLGAMVLDTSWKILACAGIGEVERIPAAGRALRWRALGTDHHLPITGNVINFTLAGGQHFGVSQSLDNRGYLVVYRSEEALEQQIAASLSGLAGASVITLVWTTALMGICTYMVAGRFFDDMDRERSKAGIEALRQRQNLVRTRDAVIFGLAKLTESRDPETGDHLDRITMYATTLATALMNHPDFKDVITPSFVRLIGISSALHDIGKVGVEDKILLKPGKLTAAERAMMEDHSRIGGECLREIERRLGRSNFLHMARDIAFSHHERWDGSGYPNGLAGEEIPLAARIVAIADVYDALSSRRVYKEPQVHQECVEVIRRGAGTQFDPRLVETWLTVADRFRDISERFRDRRTQIFEERHETRGAASTQRDFYRTFASSTPGENRFKGEV